MTEKPREGEEFVAAILLPDIVAVDGVTVEVLSPGGIVVTELPAVEFPVVLPIAPESVVTGKGVSVEERHVGGGVPSQPCVALLGIDVLPGLSVVLLAGEDEADIFEIVPLGAG